MDVRAYGSDPARGCKGISARTTDYEPAIPDQVLERLTPPERGVLMALTCFWAWFPKTTCFPATRTIAGKLGLSVGHTARLLRQLRDKEVVALERDERGRRVIRLLWRAPALAAEVTGAPPVSAPARSELRTPERPRETPSVQSTAVSLPRGRTGPVPLAHGLASLLGGAGGRSTLEPTLAVLPGRHDLVEEVAHELGQRLGDSASHGFNLKVAREVARRIRPPEAVQRCLRRADSPGVRRRAAVFTAAWLLGG